MSKKREQLLAWVSGVVGEPVRLAAASWEPDEPCPECGGDCHPECGLHPAGCVYGGFTEATSHWLVVKGCTRSHGCEKPQPPHPEEPPLPAPTE